MESLFIYFLVFFSGTFFTKYKSKNIFNLQNFIGIFILIIFAAGRYKVGTDSQAYLNFFERCSFYTWRELFLVVNKEWVFAIIAKIAYSTGGRVLTWGVYATLIVLPTYLTLKKQYPKCKIEVAFFSFLCFFYATSFNVTRQFIAVSIIFWGMKFIYKNSFYKYLSVILLAIGFHSSAIVGIALWFLWDHKNDCPLDGRRKIIVFFIILVSVIGYQFIIEKFTSSIDFFSGYAEYDKGYGGRQNRSIYIGIFELLILLILKKYFYYKDKRIEFMYILFIISVLVEITGFSHPQVKRIAYYFSFPSKIVLFGYLPYAFRNNSKALVKNFIYIYSFGVFVLVFFILKQSHLIPYHFDLFSK